MLQMKRKLVRTNSAEWNEGIPKVSEGPHPPIIDLDIIIDRRVERLVFARTASSADGLARAADAAFDWRRAACRAIVNLIFVLL